MPITVLIPSILRSYCGGALELTVSARNVRQALGQIEEHYPELYCNVCNETGAVRTHINVFVNSSLVRGDAAFDERLADGDVVSIFQAVSGG